MGIVYAGMVGSGGMAGDGLVNVPGSGEGVASEGSGAGGVEESEPGGTVVVVVPVPVDVPVGLVGSEGAGTVDEVVEVGSPPVSPLMSAGGGC